MFVLGIDPGLTATGYALVRRGHRPVAVAAGVIRTSAKEAMEDRLAVLDVELTALVGEHRPDVMALETVFTNRNRRTAIAVGRASGVAMSVAGRHGIPVVEYTPSQIKSAVTGDGTADKRAVQTMVASRLRLSTAPSPADAADALAIAICHLQARRMAPAGHTAVRS